MFYVLHLESMNLLPVVMLLRTATVVVLALMIRLMSLTKYILGILS